MKRLGTLIVSLLLTSSLFPVAYAQSPVSVIGAVTPGNCTAFSSNTVIKDAGVTCTGGGGGFVTGPNPSVVGNAATWGNTVGTQLLDSGTTLRQRLLGNLALYVNGNSGGTATCGPAGASTCAAGNDANNCLTPSTACLTLQRAYGIFIGNIDFAYTYTGTAYLAHNTGTTNYDLACTSGPVIGQGVFFIAGDSASPTATVIQDADLGNGLQVKDGCTVDISYVSFEDSVSTNAAQHIIVGGSGNAGHLDMHNVTFGSMALSGATELAIGGQGSAALTGPLSVTGGATALFSVTGPANFSMQGQLVTFSGSPAFSEVFLGIDGGEVVATSADFTGTVTGNRCLIIGPLNTGGINPNAIFPGNADCVANEYVGAIALQTGTGGSSSFSYGTAGQALVSGGGATAKNTWSTITTLTGAGFVADYVTSNYYLPFAINGSTTGSVPQDRIWCFFGTVGQQVTIKGLTVKNNNTSTRNAQMAIYSVSGDTLTFIDATPNVSLVTTNTAYTGTLGNTTDVLKPGILYGFCFNQAATNSMYILAGGSNLNGSSIGSSTAINVLGTQSTSSSGIVSGKSIAQAFGSGSGIWPGTLTLSTMSDEPITTNTTPVTIAFQVN